MSAVDTVLDLYPDLPRTHRSIARITGGSNTAPWLIAAKHGSYVLRRLPEYLGPDRARIAATVHAHAARKMDVVPAVAANGDGDLITEHAGHHYLLTQHAPGSPFPLYAPTPAQCRHLGDVLGQLHQRLRHLPAPDEAPRQRVPDDPAVGLRAAVAAHERPGCPHASTRKILAAKQRRARALGADDLDVLRALPVAFVHGDFHPGNVLVIGERVSAVLDFDLARLAPPAYELVRALLYCTHPAGPTSVYAPQVTAFFTGYLTAAPLSRHELGTMADLFETTQILDTHGLDVCEGVSPGLLAFGHARFALLYWLRHNNGTLTDLALKTHEIVTVATDLRLAPAELELRGQARQAAGSRNRGQAGEGERR